MIGCNVTIQNAIGGTIAHVLELIFQKQITLIIFAIIVQILTTNKIIIILLIRVDIRGMTTLSMQNVLCNYRVWSRNSLMLVQKWNLFSCVQLECNWFLCQLLVLYI